MLRFTIKVQVGGQGILFNFKYYALCITQVQSNGETNASDSSSSQEAAKVAAAAPETKAEQVQSSGDDASEKQSEPGTKIDI